MHGIVNHYGMIGLGHYVSYVRNPFDDKWYRYDDLYRDEVSEDQLHKESAYLLFYVRKDLESKDLTDVLPDIEKDYFSGKPVKYNGLDGFIAQRPHRRRQQEGNYQAEELASYLNSNNRRFGT